MTTTRNRRRRTLSRRRPTRGGLALLGLIVAGFVVATVFFDDMGLKRYLGMRQQAEALEREIFELERSNEELREEIIRVQRDPARIEELARERLGFVRDGETVYKIVRGSQR